SLDAVLVADPGHGQYRVTVSDGRRLVHVQGMCPEMKNEDTGELGCPPDASVLVPREAWDVMFRIAPRITGHRRYHTAEKTSPVRMPRLAAGRLLLPSAERTLTTDQIDGHYPAWRDVLPKDKPLAVVNVQPKLLAELLTAIASTLPDNGQNVALC